MLLHKNTVLVQEQIREKGNLSFPESVSFLI